MPARPRKRGDDPTPYERYIRDPKTNKVKAISRPIARRRTMPPESTKPKDAPRPLEEVARDPTPGRLVPLRPIARSTTMPPEYEEKGDPYECRNPAPDYITMQSKGYDKSIGRASHRGGRTDTTTEGSDSDEATDDGGAAGPEAAAREDTDDGNSDEGGSVDGSTTDKDSSDGHTVDRDSYIRDVTDGDNFDGYTDDGYTDDGYTDDEDTDDEDAVGVQTGGTGPAAMGADGEDDSGRHTTYRVMVEEEVTRASPARRLAARRDDATTPTARVETRTRDSSERYLGSPDLVIRNAGRDRRDDVRGYSAGREAPTRESRERDFGGSEFVRRDHGRPHPQYGASRMVPVESILDRMPPLEVGDDNFVADRNWELDPDSVQFERQQRLAPEEGWEVAQHWRARERIAWQNRNIARQRAAQQVRNYIRQRQEEQRQEEQYYEGRHHGGQHHGGQGYQGQGYHGQVGQGRGAENATRTMRVRSRDYPRDDPTPAYTPYDQTYTGPNRYR